MGHSHYRRRIRLALLLSILVLALLLGKPAYLWIRAWLQDRPVAEDLPPGFVDDASRLNLTRVQEVWKIPTDPAAAESQLQALLQRARNEGLPIAIAGARHSMGVESRGGAVG